MKPADKEEMLNVYDENHNFLGVEKRSVVHNLGLWHDEICLCVLDVKNNKILLQKRNKFKRVDPDKWGMTAGHVTSSETIEQCLFKEAREELGIDLNKYKPQPMFVLKRDEEHARNFFYYYYIDANIPIDEFKIQKEELSEVKYFDYDQLKQNIKDKDKSLVYTWDATTKKVFDELDKLFAKRKKKT